MRKGVSFSLETKIEGKHYLIEGDCEYTPVGIHEWANSPGFEIELKAVNEINNDGKEIPVKIDRKNSFFWEDIANSELMKEA